MLKERAEKLKRKANKIGGCMRTYNNTYELKENSTDIKDLKLWIWIIKKLINKQETNKEPKDIRKYFVSANNRKRK